MCLLGEEFVRRFLLHVLPKGLMRVCHFGFLANRGRQEKLARIRLALAAPVAVVPETTSGETPEYPCQQCRQGKLYVIALLPPRRPVADTDATRRHGRHGILPTAPRRAGGGCAPALDFVEKYR
jgi:hypothetical protein